MHCSRECLEDEHKDAGIQQGKHVNLERKTIIQPQTRQGVPGGKVNILRDHSIGHSKQKCLYVHVSYSELFLSMCGAV